ncbi:MAG: class I SAM-dependent methyltransferase [Proteobacteria bacterium]|nr:class I SAM-dependent methyltransferase [Pseudomonadota bacterium]
MNLYKLRHCLLVLAALVFAGCSGSSEPEQAVQEEPAVEAITEAPAAHDLTSLLASDTRADADRARDAGRKPAEVIAFLGIEPGMSVIDIFAAGGYYTEVLSLAVGSEGHVAAQNPAFILQMREGVNEKALTERLADNRLANVSRLDKELADISAADGPFDAGMTALNFHDIYNNYGEDAAIAMMNVVSAALKPGGVFGIIDHQGIEDNDNKELHRALKADVIRVAEAAGFVVEGDSGILHMHDDDMMQSVFAEEIRGKTNRFLLKLRKPGG